MTPSSTPSASPDMQAHWIDGPQGRLYAQRWAPPHAAAASRTPIVLLHDSLGSVAQWRGFPAALCAQTARPVLAYDRLGFGQSAPYPGALPPDFIAQEAETSLAAICRHFALTRFALFGHSVGGGMAVCAAARFPQACVALVTASAQAFVEDRTLEGIRQARRMFSQPGQIERLKKYHGDKAQWVLDAWIGSWLSPAFASWSLAPELPRVVCPALVLHGADDEYGTPRHPQCIGEKTGGPAQVAVMPGTRHMPHRENEAAVLAQVSAFFRDLP